MLAFLLGAIIGIIGVELCKDWLESAPLGYENATGWHPERRTLPRRGIEARGTGARPAPEGSEAFVAIASRGFEA